MRFNVIDRGMFNVLDLFIDPILMVRGFRICLKVLKITLTTCLKARLMTRSFKSDDDMRRPLEILDRVFFFIPLCTNGLFQCKRFYLVKGWVANCVKSYLESGLRSYFFKSVKKA